jgi:Ser/Thr protein kinase RdoA (MazF antagonist)
VSGAIEAAVAVARGLGLRVGEPRELGTWSNHVIHLAPAPVVARVATLTSRIRPGGDWLDDELAVCAWLGARGAPVLPPTDACDPGPHDRDGFRMTLWPYVEPVEPEPAAAGAELRELHEALVDFPRELRSWDPKPEVEAIAAYLEREGAAGDAAALRELSSRLTVPEVQEQPIHGDAHLGNVLGPRLWGDWEDVCRGPVEWDVATLQAAARVFGDDDPARAAAVAAYGQHDEELVEELLPLRVLFVTAWGAVGTLDHPKRRVRLDRRLAWLRERLRPERG